MATDSYVTYVNAFCVAVAWLGAMFGPFFLVVGLHGGSFRHVAIGGGLLTVVLVAVRQGFKGLRLGIKSTFIASRVAPLAFLTVGIGLAYFSAPTGSDSCLDLGGSFNYRACGCDYSQNHEVMSEHLCW